MCDPKSSGKVTGKLVVPLSALHRPGLSSSKPPPAFPLEEERWRENFLEAVSRWEASPCSRGMAGSQIPPDRALAQAPKQAKGEREKRKKGLRGEHGSRGSPHAPCPPNLPPKQQSSAAGSQEFSRGRESWCLPAGSSTNASYKLKVFTVFKEKTATPPPSSLPPGPPSSSSAFTLLPTPSPRCAPRLCPATGARAHPCATPRWGLTPKALKSGT